MALSAGKKANTYTFNLKGCILKMQGACELRLEQQMFSFWKQNEAEKLAKSSRLHQAVTPSESLICPQA